jgi:hypothetical protein
MAKITVEVRTKLIARFRRFYLFRIWIDGKPSFYWAKTK